MTTEPDAFGCVQEDPAQLAVAGRKEIGAVITGIGHGRSVLGAMTETTALPDGAPGTAPR